MGHLPTLVSSHDMLQGSNMDRDSQNCIVCPNYLMLQVYQPCISLYIIHGSQIQKCIVICPGIPKMHATRWLGSKLIVFLKRLADFVEKMKICTIPTWKKFTFLHRNSKLVILTRHPNHALIIENMYERCFRANPLNMNSQSFVKSTKNNFAYTFLRGSCENGGWGRCCAFGTNKISKLRPQSCNESKLWVIPKTLGC